jgi:hypothetical protein
VIASLAGVLLGPGCTFGGPHTRPEPPEPAIRIWMPDLVRWSGGRREISLELENGTDHTVRMEVPDARRVRVVIFMGSGPDRACGVEPDASGPPGPAVTLAPRDVTPVTIDLEHACGGLPPGEYRFEVGYEAPAPGKGGPFKMRARHGHLVVDAAPAGPEQGSLGSGGATRSR